MRFLPQGKYQLAVCWVLLGVILVSGGVVGKKYHWNNSLRELWAWQERVVRFPAESLKTNEVRKYGVKAKPDVKAGPFPRAEYTWRLPMSWEYGPACWADGTTTGNGWSCTLALVNMDSLLNGAEDGMVSVSASSGGGSGSIALIDTTAGGVLEPSWPAAAQAALAEWTAQIPDSEYGEAKIWTFLCRATLSVSGADDQYIYKCFGWVEQNADYAGPPSGVYTWVGDTEWILPFSSSITGIKPKMTAAVQSGPKYAYPRSPQHRQVLCELYSTGETIRTATLGGMSLSAAEELPTDENGKILSQAGIGGVGGMFFNCSLACEAPAVDTSYCEVQGVTCSTENVPVSLAASFWSNAYDALGSGWDYTPPSLTQPEGAIWHAFNSGSTFKLHRVGGGGSASIVLSTILAGPTRWNINAGRFAPKMSLTDFPLPTAPGAPADDPPSLGVQAGAWRVDVGLRYAQDEDPANDQTVWLGQGLSEYYTWSRTTRSDGAYLRTGTYSFPNSGATCIVDRKWLEYSGELCEFQAVDDEGTPISAVIDNSYAKIAMQSLAGSLDSSSPYWGPAIKYAHTDISADIPPGYTTRPSKWHLNGVELTALDPDDGKLLWEIEGESDRLLRTLLSRKAMRFDYLCQWDQGKPGFEYPCNADWPLINKANYAGAGDTPAMKQAIPVEDVVNYDNSRLLVFTFGKVPATVDWSLARLTLIYSHYDFVDDSYTPSNHRPVFRFGADSDFPENYSVAEAEYTFKGMALPLNPQAPNGPTTLAFDLAQLPRDNDTHLQHVDSVALTGLLAGTYTLADMRLQKDKRSISAFPLT